MIVTYIVAAALGSIAPSRGGSVNPTARVPNLCGQDEQPVFTCKLKKHVASVCSRSHNGGVQNVVYRFGRRGDITFVYPTVKVSSSQSAFKASTANFTGGEEQHLRFSSGPYEYIAFHAFEGGCCDKAGHRENSEEAGIVVRRRGRVLSNLKCEDPSRSTILLDGLPKENFEPVP